MILVCFALLGSAFAVDLAPPAEEALRYQPPGDCHSATTRLADLVAADQADRVRWNPRIERRDTRRNRQLHRLVSHDRVCTPHEHAQAATILLHSMDPSDHLLAHTLSWWAMSQGEDSARWISAAAFDRWHVSRGLPQWYGTQMRQNEGRTCLIDLIGGATDEDRAAMNVPPLADLVQKVARAANVTLDTPDLSSLTSAGLTCPPVAWEARP